MSFYYFSDSSKIIIENSSIKNPSIDKVKYRLIRFFYHILNSNNTKYKFDLHWFNYSKNLTIFQSDILNVIIYCRKNKINRVYSEIIPEPSILILSKILRIEIINDNYFLSHKVNFLKILFLNIILILYSIASITFLYFKKERIIGLWTGDFSSTQYKCDPRISELYNLFKQNKHPYIELIRSNTTSPKIVLLNLIKRRRPAIYYDSFIFFVNLYKIQQGCSLFNYLAFRGHSPTCDLILIKIFKFIFKKINLKILIPWFSSSRTIHLIAAASLNQVKSIGFMHGLSFISNMRHEYMPEYNGGLYPKLYKFGVYSDYFKQEFVNNSTLYEKIEVSGPLFYKQNNISLNKKNNANFNTALFISETHSNVDELIPFYDLYLSNHSTLHLKIRNYTSDIFYENLKKYNYSNFNRIVPVSLSAPSCFENYDIVIGSHSTLLVEASAHNKCVLILYTNKYKDFFKIQSDENLSKLLVLTPDDLTKKISFNNKNDSIKFKEKFFCNKSGLEWVQSTITELGIYIFFLLLYPTYY